MKKYNVIFNCLTSIALTGLWVLCPAKAHAQESTSNSEVAITVGGLAAMLDYDIPNTEVTKGQGINVGLEYTYYFANNFGLSVGAEYQRLSATAKTESLSGAYTTTDYEQESFEFRYNMEKVVEEQKMNFVSIPVMLVYQNQQYGFYIRGGAKIGLPISAKYTTKYDMNSSGYYPQYNGELFDPEFMGFGSFENVSGKGNSIDTKISYIATVELGVRQPIGKGTLYGGIYLDYGLNDIAKKGSHPVVYDTNQSGVEFGSNSLLNSDQVSNLKTKAFGIKLRYSFWNF